MISVVIPVFNAAATLGVQLDSLAKQECSAEWELIVADNGSTDESVDLARSRQDQFSRLRVVDASARRGASAARNIGASAAEGDFLVFCDADDVACPGWLAAYADAMEAHEFVAGAMEYDTLNVGTHASWRRYRSHVDSLPVGLDFLPYALSSNMGVSRRAFEAVGAFSEQFAGAAGEDVDLSWRLQLAGYGLHLAPHAMMHYRFRSDLRELWGQYLAYGRAEVLLYKRFRASGLRRTSYPMAVYQYFRLISRFPKLLNGATRGGWILSAARRLGRIRGSIAERVVFL